MLETNSANILFRNISTFGYSPTIDRARCNPTAEALTAARDHAERQLQQLLRIVADTWSINRYGGLDIEYRTNANTTASVWCFASLWDWSVPEKRNTTARLPQLKFGISSLSQIAQQPGRPPRLQRRALHHYFVTFTVCCRRLLAAPAASVIWAWKMRGVNFKPGPLVANVIPRRKV